MPGSSSIQPNSVVRQSDAAGLAPPKADDKEQPPFTRKPPEVSISEKLSTEMARAADEIDQMEKQGARAARNSLERMKSLQAMQMSMRDPHFATAFQHAMKGNRGGLGVLSMLCRRLSESYATTPEYHLQQVMNSVPPDAGASRVLLPGVGAPPPELMEIPEKETKVAWDKHRNATQNVRLYYLKAKGPTHVGAMKHCENYVVAPHAIAKAAETSLAFGASPDCRDALMIVLPGGKQHEGMQKFHDQFKIASKGLPYNGNLVSAMHEATIAYLNQNGRPDDLTWDTLKRFVDAEMRPFYDAFVTQPPGYVAALPPTMRMLGYQTISSSATPLLVDPTVQPSSVTHEGPRDSQSNVKRQKTMDNRLLESASSSAAHSELATPLSHPAIPDSETPTSEKDGNTLKPSFRTDLWTSTVSTGDRDDFYDPFRRFRRSADGKTQDASLSTNSTTESTVLPPPDAAPPMQTLGILEDTQDAMSNISASNVLSPMLLSGDVLPKPDRDPTSGHEASDSQMPNPTALAQ